MLTRGATAKVPPRQQDRRVLVARRVQLEVGLRATVGIEAPVEKQELAEAGALDPLEKLLGNDLVRIDIGSIERGHDSGMGDERLHALAPLSNVDEVTADRSGRRHRRAHQVGSTALALAPFEVTV